MYLLLERDFGSIIWEVIGEDRSLDALRRKAQEKAKENIMKFYKIVNEQTGAIHFITWSGDNDSNR